MIQEKEFTPLGSTDPIKVDVRILAATNADLHQLVKEGKFREDLYYRLNVINMALPPLRERKEDIPLLVDHFFTYYCRENDKFLDSAGPLGSAFPAGGHAGADGARLAGQRARAGERGGARRGAGHRGHRAGGGAADALLEANGIRLHRGDGAPLPADASLFEIVNDYERRVIIERLEQCNWSQTDAAESLHVPLSTLNQKIKRLDIKIKKKGEGLGIPGRSRRVVLKFITWPHCAPH